MLDSFPVMIVVILISRHCLNYGASLFPRTIQHCLSIGSCVVMALHRDSMQPKAQELYLGVPVG